MLRVRIHVPERQPDDKDRSVRVELRDTSIADALHPTVAEAWAMMDDASDQVEVALDVPEASLASSHRYSLWAHVGSSSGRELQRGDLITTIDIPVTASDVAAGTVFDVPLTRI